MTPSNKLLFLFFCICLLLTNCDQQIDEKVPYSNEDVSLLNKVDSLLVLMTLEEKIGQLAQISTRKIEEDLIEKVKQGEVSSLLINRELFFTIEDRNRIQRYAVEESRLGIPIIFGHDVIHGFKTIFPTNLGQSCTWSPDLIEEASAIAAKEASASGVDWTFAPMVDIARDPRWGRISETYGEDPHLSGVLGAAAVKGFQGEDVSAADKVVACMKHYVGYGAATGGLDYQYTEISERTMHELYLRPFKAAAEAGVLTTMTAFNDINGVPASGNAQYVRGILKEKWDFPGFVVSDWESVLELMDHGIAADTIDAAILGIKAGIDMEMKSNSYAKLDEAVSAGKVDVTLIDEAVRRILFIKYKKGLFENPYTDTSRLQSEIITQEHREVARKVARESMVLVKNDQNTLPLLGSLNVAVVGPFAKSNELMGWWKSTGEEKDVVTPFDGLLANAPTNLSISDQISGATDIIVACVGEKMELFGEAHSRSELTLPGEQEEWLAGLKKYGTKIVVVVFNGRPLALSKVNNLADALLIGWHPGTETGNALADVLYGGYNLSGKLTSSFPHSIGQIPIYYSKRNSGRSKQLYSDTKLSWDPLFPFGYGLSYSNFEYSNLKLSKELLDENDTISVSATISNTSERDGVETVQLYVRDMIGTTTRPIKELVDFERVTINSGESIEVSFTLHTDQLRVLDKNFEPQYEKGDYTIWIGPNSVEGLEASFKLN